MGFCLSYSRRHRHCKVRCNFLLLLRTSELISYVCAFCFPGNVAVVTDRNIITQPYPIGPRSTASRLDPYEHYQCTTCDPGAPTEQCFPDFNLCAKLSDTDIALFGTNGTLLSSVPLDRDCHPRDLQRLVSPRLHLGVDCHNFTSQVASIVGTMLSVLEHGGRTVQSEIMVEGAGMHQETEVYIVEIDGNYISQTNFHSGTRLDITPNTDCSDFISLFPLFTRDKFLLWCDSNTGSRFVYIVDVLDVFGLDSAPSVSSDSPPLSSPDGQTFLTVTNTTIHIYRTDDVTFQPPAVSEFAGPISFHTYIDNNTLLLVIDGQGQVLVNVNTFIDSSGTAGITPLPTASVDATLHKLLTHEVYATYNKTGALFNLLLFNTSDGRLLSVFANFPSEPTDVFFQQSPDQASTQTPASQPPVISSPPTTSPATSVVSNSSYMEPRPTTTTSLSLPMPTPHVPSDAPTNPKVVTHAVLIAVPILFIVAVLIVACVLCQLYIRKWRRRSSNCTFHSTGPVEETNESSGRGSASPDRFSLSSFFERTSVSGYESAPSGQPTHPIPETTP